MTWGSVIDTRRAIVTMFLIGFILILMTFMCVLTLVGSQILEPASSSSTLFTLITTFPK
jgi:hypothetical protein